MDMAPQTIVGLQNTGKHRNKALALGSSRSSLIIPMAGDELARKMAVWAAGQTRDPSFHIEGYTFLATPRRGGDDKLPMTWKEPWFRLLIRQYR